MRTHVLLLPVVMMMAAQCCTATAQDAQVWCTSSLEKVFRDSEPRPLPAEGAALSCAGGEYEAFQLVLRPSTDLRDVRVAVGPLAGPGGETLAAEVLEVHYVPAPATAQKMWPDPLPPHRGPMEARAGQNQPWWVRFHAEPGQTPGAYRGTACVSATGLSEVRVPVTLTVLPFTLSERPRVRTAFGISSEFIYQQHKETDPAAQAELYREYYEELLRHGLSAYEPPYGTTDPRALRYLRDPRVTSYVIPYRDDPRELRQTALYLMRNNVFGKGFYYPTDEPFTRESYKTLATRANLVHGVAGNARVCSPFYRGPDFDDQKDVFDYAGGLLDIWCINTGYYGPRQMAAMEQCRRYGEELWWYVCCGPGAPHANYFVTMEAIRHRILAWQMYRYDIQGLLYWSTTYWSPSSTKDPWEDMATVKDINPDLIGDGSLLYPGAKLGIAGPVSSIRLECIRDGLEDLQYLALLERLQGRDKALAYVGELVTDMTQYSLDADQLLGVRERLGRVLSRERGM
jgi:hypothetical protein